MPSVEKINLAPETEAEEIAQNVAIILSSPQMSVPLDRALGLPQKFVDLPIKAARVTLISEVYNAIEAYEPRAKVKKVTVMQGETPGKLIPYVEVEIGG